MKGGGGGGQRGLSLHSSSSEGTVTSMAASAAPGSSVDNPSSSRNSSFTTPAWGDDSTQPKPQDLQRFECRQRGFDCIKIGRKETETKHSQQWYSYSRVDEVVH